MYDYEQCLKNLRDMASSLSDHIGDLNEAMTRVLLIDRLFYDCLGWSKDDVKLEESHDREYSDYSFFAPRRVLIVEAKKQGQYFDLPVGVARLEYPLPTLLRDHKQLATAIKQVAGYCQARGAPYAVVCNGHQLVAFVASRADGRPPLEGKAIVFPSLDFMCENFLELWQCLSKPAIEEKRLGLRLVGDTTPQPPSKLATTILKYPGIKGRNIFQTDLQILSELVIEDISRTDDLEEQFLRECYCSSGAHSQHSLISRAILQARYVSLMEENLDIPTLLSAVKKEGVSPELIAELTPELIADSISRRPILLIGDVGVGKTTFIRHLIKIDAKAIFTKAIAIYIDLGSQAALASNLKDFVLAEVGRQLHIDHGIDIDERKFIRGIYHGELQRFERGIYGELKESNPRRYKDKEIKFLEEKLKNKEEHLKYSLSHIAKGQRKQIVIFLDNCDQRDYHIQQEAFLIAQEMASRWPVTVFVALRPETFYSSVRAGVLSGYHPKAFTISPPRIDRVIEKRLSFAKRITSGGVQIKALPHIKITTSNLETVLEIVLLSLNKNQSLREFVDHISGGNVRLALEYIKHFLGSGHIDTRDMLERYQADQNYTIPLHHFIRAVTFGDAIFYYPLQSPLANLFDISRPDPKEHFLLPILVAILASNTIENRQGFVETSLLYEKVQGFGFTPEQIDAALIRGLRKKLLETTWREMPDDGYEMPFALRVTTVGAYHIKKLCQSFAYIDAIIVDTPIIDDGTRSRIHDVDTIQDRVKRAIDFRHYMDEQWSIFLEECKSQSLEEPSTAFDWSIVSKQLMDETSRIQKRITRSFN